ncbi:T9SS type A sorting domain-containing protein [Labilibacter sediminis]|nr:T9SS type A sorting domain-containing protein [Labilibacter sediminis]
MGRVAIFIGVLLCFGANVFSQEYIWSGKAENSDFFDEGNWTIQGTQSGPSEGSIDPSQAINANLTISDEVEVINALGEMFLGTGNLTIINSTLSSEAIGSGSVTIGEKAYLTLSAENPLTNNCQINIISGMAWLKTSNVLPDIFNTNYLSQIKVSQVAANYPANIRLDNYYSQGTIVRAQDELVKPVTVYDQTNLQGNSAQLTIDQIHSGTQLPNSMNNQIQSFQLAKGYMATLAINDDGTGNSKVYIASEEDLVINELPVELQNNISFIRVIPWNWVSKKGTGGDIEGLGTTWYYLWGNSGTSYLNREYAPMAWGKNAANDQADVDLYKGKYKATHVLAFNESDNCNDQSGQWGDLCNTDVAVATYENLMKTGLRLVSPSCRENAPFGWLKDFYDKATAQDIRIDVIGIHWYDWSSSPANSPNADPQKVFNRFKNHLQKVYDLYNLPIWITEFNANPNRTNAVNKAFMELALPYLESLDYIERYAWYQPDSDVADFYDVNGNITEVGSVYANQASTPSIPELTLKSESNLEISLPTSDKTEMKQVGLEVYPNPVEDILYINCDNMQSNIHIYNSKGFLVMQINNQNQINVSKLPKGLYMIRVDKELVKFIKK